MDVGVGDKPQFFGALNADRIYGTINYFGVKESKTREINHGDTEAQSNYKFSVSLCLRGKSDKAQTFLQSHNRFGYGWNSKPERASP